VGSGAEVDRWLLMGKKFMESRLGRWVETRSCGGVLWQGLLWWQLEVGVKRGGS
jgi:hypothetical protein